MALTTVRMTEQLHGDTAVIPKVRIKLKAAVKIFAGAAVVLDGGYAAPATTATGKKSVGRACATYDNSAGADGAVVGEFERGTFGWNIGTSGDALADADIGATVYWIDDQTVGKVSTGRSAAGTLWQLENGQAFVETI